MTIYEILRHLNMSPYIRPIMHRDYDNWEEYDCKFFDEEPPDHIRRKFEMSYVGRRVYPFESLDNDPEARDNKIIEESGYELKKITWLSTRAENVGGDNCKVAAAYNQYGNEASVGLLYSSAVILADVPPAVKRKL